MMANGTMVDDMLGMVPYRRMSPLLADARECRRFVSWCRRDARAWNIVSTELYETCFAGAPEPVSTTVYVPRPLAEKIALRLVRAWEDRALRHLFSRSRRSEARAQ